MNVHTCSDRQYRTFRNLLEVRTKPMGARLQPAGDSAGAVTTDTLGVEVGIQGPGVPWFPEAW